MEISRVAAFFRVLVKNTGNMTPSCRVLEDGSMRPVFLCTVDADEFVVNKLLDRGSLAATTIVTNVQDFIMIAAKGMGVV